MHYWLHRFTPYCGPCALHIDTHTYNNSDGYINNNIIITFRGSLYIYIAYLPAIWWVWSSSGREPGDAVGRVPAPLPAGGGPPRVTHLQDLTGQVPNTRVTVQEVYKDHLPNLKNRHGIAVEIIHTMEINLTVQYNATVWLLLLFSTHHSTIRELEDEVRHLQHVNNRLHSMGTHYQLG